MERRDMDGITVFDARNDFVRAVHTLMIRYSIDGLGRPYTNRRRIMEDYAKESGLAGYGMLFAHGSARLKKPFSDCNLREKLNDIFEWVYNDNGSIRPVQEWVDEHDGGYLALFMTIVCNPLGINVSSKSSILFFPDNIYSISEHGRKVDVKMFIPGRGYYDK